MTNAVTVLSPNEASINATRQLVVAEYGEGLPYVPEHYEHEIRRELRQGCEAFIRAGRLLVVVQECAPHGEWLGMLERIGIEESQARRMMTAARRLANRATSHDLLSAAKSQSKLIELLSLPEDDFAELADTGQTGDLKVDDIAKLTVRELRAKVRELKESLQTKDERAAAREREIEAKSAEVRKLRRQWQSATPDEQIEELRRDASAAAFEVRTKIIASPSREGEDVSSLRTRASALVQAGIAAGIDQTVYLAGLFAELERDLAALREELGVPVATVADPAADAAAWDDRPVGQVR